MATNRPSPPSGSCWPRLTAADIRFLVAFGREMHRRGYPCPPPVGLGNPKGNYWVALRGEDGRYRPLDPNICNYRRGSVERHRLVPEEAHHAG